MTEKCPARNDRVAVVLRTTGLCLPSPKPAKGEEPSLNKLAGSGSESQQPERAGVGARMLLYDRIRKASIGQVRSWRIRRNAWIVAENVSANVTEAWIRTGRFERLACELKAKKPGVSSVVTCAVRQELGRELRRQALQEEYFKQLDEDAGERGDCE